MAEAAGRLMAPATPLDRESGVFGPVRRLLGDDGQDGRQGKTGGERDRLKQVREYLHSQHFLDRVTLADLEEVSGLSKYYVVKLFRKEYGVPPMCIRPCCGSTSPKRSFAGSGNWLRWPRTPVFTTRAISPRPSAPCGRDARGLPKGPYVAPGTIFYNTFPPAAVIIREKRREAHVMKVVMIIDKELPLGLIANTAAVLGASLGKMVDGLIGGDLRDADGNVHLG
jgi:AraC-like DNA-binding protein